MDNRGDRQQSLIVLDEIFRSSLLFLLHLPLRPRPQAPRHRLHEAAVQQGDARSQASHLTSSLQVSIVPVIAKSDCLTMAEIKKLKARILQEIAENGIRIYSLPDVDSDEDEEYKIQVQEAELFPD